MARVFGKMPFFIGMGEMGVHSAITEKKEDLTKLCRRYDVTRLKIFGSAAGGLAF